MLKITILKLVLPGERPPRAVLRYLIEDLLTQAEKIPKLCSPITNRLATTVSSATVFRSFSFL
jgi:hypothetical protein